VVAHAIGWARTEGRRCDLVCLLQPTSPLRTAADIDAALAVLTKKKAGAVVSVCEVDHHPYLANTLPADGCMRDFVNPAARNRNRQELPTYYRLNGAIYVSQVDYLLANHDFLGPETFAYVMPRERSVDIDTMVDWRLAESLLGDRSSP